MNNQRKALLEMNLFDVTYYLQQYPDIKESSIEPIKHYLHHGINEGRQITSDQSNGINHSVLYNVLLRNKLRRSNIVPRVIQISNLKYRDGVFFPTNNDVKFEFKLPKPTSHLKIALNIASEAEITSYIFFKCADTEHFSKSRSIRTNRDKNGLTVAYIDSILPITHLRIDLIDPAKPFSLTFLTFRALSSRLHNCKLYYNAFLDIKRLLVNNSDLIRKFITELNHNGWLTTFKKVKRKIVHHTVSLNRSKHLPCKFKLQKQKLSDIKVSVIIPTYNRASLLPRLLECWHQVNQHTRYKYEIIFSDDGSDDGSVEILKRETSLPIKIIENNHGGAAKARNSAILAAIGEKLLIIGDDIFPNPEIINQHYEKLLQLPICKAVLGEIVWHHDLTPNFLMKHITELGNEQFSFNHFQKYSYTDYRHFYTSNISIDREFVLTENTIFDESFYKVNFEDVELGYRLSKKGMEIYYYPDAVAEHYHPYTSISKFCLRQETAGEMAVVFKSLHPEVEWIVQIDLIIKAWSRDILDLQNRNKQMNSINDSKALCQYIEENLERFGTPEFKNHLSETYQVLFRFFYEVGVVKKILNPSNDLIEKIFANSFLPKILGPLKISTDIEVLSKVELLEQRILPAAPIKLAIIVDNTVRFKELKTLYFDCQEYLSFYLKTDTTDQTEQFVYYPESTYALHPANLKQVLMYMQMYPKTETIVLSFGLQDLPVIGMAGELKNNMIHSRITSKAALVRNIKVIRLISEKSEYVTTLKILFPDLQENLNDYGFVSSQILEKHKRNTLHLNFQYKSERKAFFVFPTFLAVGGVERNTIEIINQLKEEYDFIIINFERLTQFHGSLHHQFIDSCVGLYDLTELSGHEDILVYLEALTAMYKPEIVWVCNGSPWFARNTTMIRKILHRAAIVDQEVYDYNEGWIQLYKEHNKGLLQFDRFIAINSKIKKVFTDEVGIPQAKVQLIYHVVKSKKFQNALYTDRFPELSAKYELNQENANFAFVGRMSDQKRPLLFLETVSYIIKKISNIHFFMIGNGPLTDEVETYINKHHLKNHVTRIEFIENVAEIYSLLDGLVITSKYEGLPIAMLEAMCMGLPIFATNVGDIDVVLNEYQNGIVVSKEMSPIEMSNEFIQFYNKLSQYKKYAIQAAAQIRDRFSENAIASEYRNCFNIAMKAKK